MSLHSVSVALSDSLPLEFCFVVLKEGRKELESHSRVLFADGRMGYVCVCVCWSVVCCESVSWFSGAVSGLASTFDPATKQVIVLPQQEGDEKINILMNSDSAEEYWERRKYFNIEN